MGAIRAFGKHTKWTRREENILRKMFGSAPWPVLQNRLARDRKSIVGKAYGMGLKRVVLPKRTYQERLKAKRESMARRRALNPESARAYNRNFYQRNIVRQRAKQREYCRRHFFWQRVRSMRGSQRATAREIASLWKKQRGCCALTGRRLGRENAQLDHVTPRALGGSHTVDNLRWVCAAANYAKRDQTDADFIQLCRDVVKHARRTKRLLKG